MKYLISLCVAFAGILPPCVLAEQKPVVPAPKPAVLYVGFTNDEACLEFGPDGVFFLRSALGRYSSGSWMKTNKTVILSPGIEIQRVLADNDETLVDQSGAGWKKAGPAPVRKDDHCKSVRIAVRDIETGKPVKDFSYDYWIDAPSGRETTRWARRKEVHERDGTVVISAPVACDLTVAVESLDYVNGIGSWGIFTIEAADSSPSFEIELKRGVTVNGTVVDAVDGRPVENARVAAVAAISVGAYDIDSERVAATDRYGRFVLRGVDPELGLVVRHPAYLEFDGARIAETAYRTGALDMSVKVAMEKGRRVKGLVVDSDRNPIEGVTVGGIGLKNVQTGKDGRFSLSLPDKSGSGDNITFMKAGYNARRLAVPLYAKAVVLEREANMEVRGNVVGPDGRPVARFELVLGPARDTEVWQCRHSAVVNSNGCFRMEAPFTDMSWAVVRADGFAPWEGCINTGRDAVPKTITLSGGSVLRGRILCGGSDARGGSVVLIPAKWMPAAGEFRLSAGEAFLSQSATVGPGGVFRFANVDPGEYVLRVAAVAASPSEFTVSMPPKDTDLGRIEVDGLGTIRGRAFWPGIPGERWALQNAEGEIRAASDPVGDVIRSFTTDDDGFLAVSNIPAGVVAVDIISAGLSLTSEEFRSMRLARVCAGKVTDVAFNDWDGASGFSLDVTVGDGSPARCLSAIGGYTNETGTSGSPDSDSSGPELSVRLVPVPGSPAWIPEPVEFRASPGCTWIGVEDVPPGKYRLELACQRGAGLYNVLDASDIEIAPGAHAEESEPGWMTLGAGSIKGRVVLPAEDAVDTAVALVEKNGVMDPQYTVCDAEGRFGLSYLKPGTYTVFVHSAQHGWARRDEFVVVNNVRDAGEIRLIEGATVRGELFTAFEKRAGAYEIVATSDKGVRVTAAAPVSGRNGEKYAVTGLWPGEWSVALLGDDEVLRSVRVTVDGRGSFEANLAGKPQGTAP